MWNSRVPLEPKEARNCSSISAMQYAWASDRIEMGYDQDQGDGILEWKVVYRCSALAARGTKHNGMRRWYWGFGFTERDTATPFTTHTSACLRSCSSFFAHNHTAWAPGIRRPEDRRRSKANPAGRERKKICTSCHNLPQVPGFQQHVRRCGTGRVHAWSARVLLSDSCKPRHTPEFNGMHHTVFPTTCAGLLWNPVARASNRSPVGRTHGAGSSFG